MESSYIGRIIKSAAQIDSDAQKETLKFDSRQYSLAKWSTISIAKAGSVGVLTGVTGGPWSIVMEAGDVAYLLANSGRTCYGIGHILGREIDYDVDIDNILAIWAGVAEATNDFAAGKILFKIGSKKSPEVAIKCGVKILSKSALKGSSLPIQKLLTKVSAKVTEKILAKSGAKTVFKWVPIVGGVVSGGINSVITYDLINAAQQYYSKEYLAFNQDL